MKVVKATFEQIYFTGVQYLNQRLGGEVILEEGETLADAWAKMKQDANDFHKASYPHLYEKDVTLNINIPPPYGVAEQIPEQKINPEEKRIGVFVEDIMGCKDLKTLESYKFIVKSNPELQGAYDLQRSLLISNSTIG